MEECACTAARRARRFYIMPQGNEAEPHLGQSKSRQGQLLFSCQGALATFLPPLFLQRPNKAPEPYLYRAQIGDLIDLDLRIQLPGAGKLTIKKTAGGYDISDYVSESSYRFLADSSNVETTENNRIYIKYPEQVFSDDTVIFSYYILEYTSSGLDVYYGKSSPEDARFLYHATRK